MDAAELFDRYVHAVSRYLPTRQRADVAAELRSLLHDTLDAPSEDDGEPLDLRQAADLIREMGKPEVVALRYLPTRSLIGPTLYPSFVIYLRLMLIVLAAIYVGACAYSLWSLPAALPEALGRIFTTLWPFIGTAVAGVGLIVIFFGFIERAETRNPTPAGAWDPYALPAVHDPDQIKRLAMWGNVAARLLMLVVLIFLPNILASLFADEGVWGGWPRPTPEFLASFALWFSLLWVVEAGLFLLVLRQGQWRPVTRWLEVATNAATLLLLCLVARGGAILTPSFVDAFAKFGLVVVVIISAIDMIQLAYHALRLPPIVLPSIPGLRIGEDS